MIEQALYEHLNAQEALVPYLTTYDGKLAVFNQEAPSDTDALWGKGPQYGRIVFAVDINGDPERTMGGTLVVDIMCNEDEQAPEDIEPIVRALIHGYFFSNGTFTVAAQWKNSSYFTQPADKVLGCTVSFDLLGFPVLTTSAPDVIDRVNQWTSDTFEGIHVINHDELPSTAWRPTDGGTAVYWRLVTDNPADWIRETFQTIWRTATIKCHIFAPDNAAASTIARDITARLYTAKRLKKEGESPIIVCRRNQINNGADPLKTGQVTVEATYGIIVYYEEGKTIENINY